jgi:hypothetical protein
MKNILIGLALALMSLSANAQGLIVLQWTNPTSDIDGNPLTGTNVITSYQFWISLSDIPVDTTEPPTHTLAAADPLQVDLNYYLGLPGQTAYARMKVCNFYGCSKFTGQVSGVLFDPTIKPRPPTGVIVF